MIGEGSRLSLVRRCPRASLACLMDAGRRGGIGLMSIARIIPHNRKSRIVPA
jgi:hypothetical protein